ncbi:hypothetical protein FA15DRAFT_664985 [Coprinopsis marcescibilis]|uniref:Uncharacterized protein n=1 Tax=Coprinopsis marcescibilis TaxID=230819 RepID=A0A5C3L808_COPMA|nr:hypothetical protein FA15DRAFT_664985 [Coprinopsis marcescibilis]
MVRTSSGQRIRPDSKHDQLIKNLNRDAELAQELQVYELEKDNEIQRLNDLLNRTKNSVKWLTLRIQELESTTNGDVQALERKYRHALRLIRDLIHERDHSRLDPQSGLDEFDEALYNEVLEEAKQKSSKGKQKAKHPDTNSSISTSRSSQGTARPSPRPSPAPPSSLPRDRLLPLSPTSTSLRKSPEPEESVEAQAALPPWAPDSGSVAESSSTMSLSHRIITSRSGHSRSAVYWKDCPKHIGLDGEYCSGTYSWEHLRRILKISDSKFESLKSLELEQGGGMRLQICKLGDPNRSLAAFLYHPIWYETYSTRDDLVEEMHVIEWATGDQCEKNKNYLRKRGVFEQLTEASPVLQVFVNPSTLDVSTKE